jgi:hypothetical protein
MFAWLFILLVFYCLLFISALIGKNLNEARGHFWGGTPRFFEKIIHKACNGAGERQENH